MSPKIGSHSSFVGKVKIRMPRIIDNHARLYEVLVDMELVERLAVTLNAIITSLFLELSSRTGLDDALLDLTATRSAIV